MSKLRLLFVKEGPAAYISNLDLLRTMPANVHFTNAACKGVSSLYINSRVLKRISSDQ